MKSEFFELTYWIAVDNDRNVLEIFTEIPKGTVPWTDVLGFECNIWKWQSTWIRVV